MVYNKYMDNNNNNEYKNSFLITSRYLKEKHNIDVILKNIDNNFWFSHQNKIIISKKYRWKSRLNFLLHEAGHAINDKKEGLYAKSIAYAEYSNETFKSKSQFVSILNEEIRAWNTGKKLAVALSICYDIIEYNKQTTNCVMSYVKTGLSDLYRGDVDVSIINTK